MKSTHNGYIPYIDLFYSSNINRIDIKVYLLFLDYRMLWMTFTSSLKIISTGIQEFGLQQDMMMKGEIEVELVYSKSISGGLCDWPKWAKIHKKA